MINIFLGDARIFWQENIRDFIGIPQAWDSSLNTGIGQSQLNTLWITSYLNLTGLLSKIGLSWNEINLLCWILPALIFSFLSAYFLFNYLFPGNKKYSILAGIIYIFNTYSLLILTGGQTGLLLAYSLCPGILLVYIKLFNKINFKYSILAGLILSLEVLFDPRFTYIISFIAFGFWVFFTDFKKNFIKSFSFSFLIPLSIVVLIHNYWLIPLLFTNSSVNLIVSSLSEFRFFSFAKFENTSSLLHPNWPENIFGKIYFMKAEFLMLPIFAYSSLFFINKLKREQKKYILFLSFIGLLGAFLAKGANPPFDKVNEFLFLYIPGMGLFRDSTKWYLLIAISYSVLIPFSFWQISNMAKKYNKFFILSRAYLLFIVVYIFILMSQFIPNNLAKNAFKPVPNDYINLKNFINRENNFYRTFWIPSLQRYGYFSNLHPAIGRNEILNTKTPAKLIKKLTEPKSKEILMNFGVRYVIVPFDSESEIFITDRKYDEKKYKKVISELDKISWLKRVKQFGKIIVYELPSPKDHFWSSESNVKISYKYISPTKYKLNLKNVRKGNRLIFSESYDKNWIAEKTSGAKYKLTSIKYDNLFNSFIIPEDGDYGIEIYYKPQILVETGLLISSISLIVIVFLLIKLTYIRKS